MKSALRAMPRTVIVLLAIALNSQGRAATFDSRFATEIRGLKNSNSFTTLLGGRYLHQVSELFSMGGAAYTGQISNGATGSFSYGGLVAAVGKNFSDDFGLEVSFLVGGAGGFTSDGSVSGGIAIDPTLSLNLKLGDTVRAALTGGYVWLPNSTAFSGFCGGVRFEFLFGDKPKS